MREIWMLEVRGILDPRYWSTDEGEANRYLIERTWHPNERPRIVRMVEAPIHEPKDPSLESRKFREATKAILKEVETWPEWKKNIVVSKDYGGPDQKIQISLEEYRNQKAMKQKEENEKTALPIILENIAHLIPDENNDQ